jgi:hypothetical protein
MSPLKKYTYASSLIVVLCLVATGSPALAEDNEVWKKDGPNIHTTNPGAVGIGTNTPENKLDVAGNLGVGGDINFSGKDFQILGGGVLLWPGRLRFGAGGGEGQGLDQWRGMVRAQPGGNMEILPLKDYSRGALDIYPTMGKKPDFDALAELTVHRIMPSDKGHEMLSISALATEQNRFGVIVEAHGVGELKPLDFMVVRGGVLKMDAAKQPFWAQVMRMKTDGTMQFGPSRSGQRNEPVDIINIEQDEATVHASTSQEASESKNWSHFDGPTDSHFVRYTAKEFRDSQPTHRADWRSNVQIKEGGKSSFVLQSRRDDDNYEKRMAVKDNGDVELPAAASALVLTSPNGKHWRVTVDDNGKLQTSPATD